MTGDTPDNSERRPDRAAFVIAAALIVVGLAVAWGTWRTVGVAMNTPVGPKTVPFILSAALVVLGVLTGIAAARGDFPERERQDVPPMMWVIGGLLVQMMTMKSIGFSVATGLLFAATAKGFGRGPLWMTIPVGILFAAFVWALFAKGLQLSLPAGPVEQPVGQVWDGLAAIVRDAWTRLFS